MIPPSLKIKNKILPNSPGVYFFYDKNKSLLYIGKATSLKKRVNSYFTKAHDQRLTEMVSQISQIDYLETKTVIEALVLEANQIKTKKPKYNILERDDKSFLYLTITNEKFSRPILQRGLDLERLGVNLFDKKTSQKTKKYFLAVFGPYTSGAALRKSLDLLRRIIPWSDCRPPEITGRNKSCFNVHLGLCSGVCAGKISSKDYQKNISQLIMFFSGKTKRLIGQMKKDMAAASRDLKFEAAGKLRNKIFALEHIQDVAIISREDSDLPITKPESLGVDLSGRIEAYDISNISGASAVASMAVFLAGKPAKNEYRKFKIKTVKGANDVAMMEEVLCRRLLRAQKQPKAWPLPEVFVIDGGEGQVNRAEQILKEFNLKIPVIGLAKGFDRKQDRLVFSSDDKTLARLATMGKELFQQARDEAHRFAVRYHRQVRKQNFLITPTITQ
ncbi:MAG: excinuclease ABC subunit UvrC [Candidatus Uhrbacteria bacterium]